MRIKRTNKKDELGTRA